MLIENAKAVVQNCGQPYNMRTPATLYEEISQAIIELEDYRILNRFLKLEQLADGGHDSDYFERYFKSRIISGKRIIFKLGKLVVSKDF